MNNLIATTKLNYTGAVTKIMADIASAKSFSKMHGVVETEFGTIAWEITNGMSSTFEGDIILRQFKDCFGICKKPANFTAYKEVTKIDHYMKVLATPFQAKLLTAYDVATGMAEIMLAAYVKRSIKANEYVYDTDDVMAHAIGMNYVLEYCYVGQYATRRDFYEKISKIHAYRCASISDKLHSHCMHLLQEKKMREITQLTDAKLDMHSYSRSGKYLDRACAYFPKVKSMEKFITLLIIKRVCEVSPWLTTAKIVFDEVDKEMKRRRYNTSEFLRLVLHLITTKPKPKKNEINEKTSIDNGNLFRAFGKSELDEKH